MATILRAYNDLGIKYDLDVFNEQQFLLDISAIESGDIGKVFGISSQTFALPPTKNNVEYFGNLYDLGATYPSGSLNNTPNSAPSSFIKTMPCQVLSDGIQIFNGKLYLDSIITDEDGDTIFNVNVVNETIDFKYLIQDLTFGDLDWSAYNHDYTYTNISSSWDLDLFSGSIVYPLCEYGIDDKDLTATLLKSGGAPKTFTNALSPLLIKDFKPAIRVNTILDTIFDSINYKYTSSLFESAYADTIYMLATRDNTRGIPSVNPLSQSFEARNTSTQNISAFTPTKVVFDNEIYDNAGNYSPVNYRFTAGEDGLYSFDVQLTTRLTNITSPNLARLATTELYVNGAYVGIPPVITNLKGATNNSLKVITANFSNLNLEANDYVEVYISFDPDDASEVMEIRTLPSLTYWKCYQSPLTYIGGNVDLSAVFNPEDSVLAFINGLITKFNLVIEPLRDNPKVLSIEPFNTWVDNGNVVDWTDKVDRSKKWEIRHPMANQPRTINFSDIEDKDEFNQYSIRTFDKIFGSSIYYSESDLADGEKKIGTYFAPTPMKYIEGTSNFIVPQIYTINNGQPTRLAFKPRLLHYLGLQNANLRGKLGATTTYNTWYFKDENGTTHPMSQYPQFHHVSALNDFNAKDLHFNNPQHWEYHQNVVSARTIHDASYEYWSFYVNELYDIDGRLLTLNVDLKPTDIPKIRLNDKIFIDGHYYRINKISGANLTNEQSTKVELIKSLPRKLYFPRRRIQDSDLGIGIGYKDVYVGDISITGGVVYNDWNTDTPLTKSVITDTAGYRDNLYVYTGSIQVGSPAKAIPRPDTEYRANYITEELEAISVRGGGNIAGGQINEGTITGNNNTFNSIIGTLNAWGDNISTTGSSDSIFVVNTTTSSVSINDIGNVIALNPIEPITTSSFYQNEGVAVGNIRIQGNLYTSYDIITGSAGGNISLTGSHIEHYLHYFSWSGSNGDYTAQLEDANLVDGIQMRFMVNGDYSGGPALIITPSGSQTINGNASLTLNQPYEGTILSAVDGEWLQLSKNI